MKFLRFICNTLLFFCLSVVLSLVQIGGYDLVACQDNFGLDKNKGSSIEVVNVIPSENYVEYADTFTFWGTDIATGVKTPAKYRIRNWGNDIWRKGMKWADIALDSTIAVFKPIFAPVAQANAVKDYYLTESYDINSVIYRFDSAGEVSIKITSDELYEMYILFNKFTYDVDPEKILCNDGVTLLSNYVYAGAYSTDPEKYNADYFNNELNYMQWVKEHKDAYNIDWKLQKYNNSAYTKYFKKFVHSEQISVSANFDGNTAIIKTETRALKSSIVVLYFIQLTSIILALVFVIKYPISLLQGRISAGKRFKRKKEE